MHLCNKDWNLSNSGPLDLNFIIYRIIKDYCRSSLMHILLCLYQVFIQCHWSRHYLQALHSSYLRGERQHVQQEILGWKVQEGTIMWKHDSVCLSVTNIMISVLYKKTVQIHSVKCVLCNACRRKLPSLTLLCTARLCSTSKGNFSLFQ